MDLSGIDLTTEVVRTERLVLRPPRAEDEDAVFRACQDREILRWTANLPDPYTRPDAESWVRAIAPSERAEGRGLPCVIEAGGELVGSVGLTFVSGRAGGDAEVGYWIAPGVRRQGYATEAARALAEWALRRGAARVRLLTKIRNEASQAVAVRAGFRPDGVLRRALTERDGSRVDAAVFVRTNGG